MDPQIVAFLWNLLYYISGIYAVGQAYIVWNHIYDLCNSNYHLYAQLCSG